MQYKKCITELQNQKSKGVLFLFICFMNSAQAMPVLSDLFAGGSYSNGNLEFTNFTLGSTNVDVTNITIGSGFYGSAHGGLDIIDVWSQNNVLFANQPSGSPITKTLTFDYLVTGIGVDITQIKGGIGYSYVNGYNSNTPWISETSLFGTSEGSKNLGSVNSMLSLNQNIQPGFINIPNGLQQIWVENTITLYSSSRGYAQSGYVNGVQGPAFYNSFVTTPVSVPEPTSIALLAAGLFGLFSSRRKTIQA